MARLRIFTIVFLFIIRCHFPKLKSLSEVVRFSYGNHVLKFIRKFKKLDYRVCKINVDIEFLKSCVENDLCPTFLCYKMSSKRLQNSESDRHSQHLFLQEEISLKTVESEKIIREIQLIRDNLRTVMSFLDWVHISN